LEDKDLTFDKLTVDKVLAMSTEKREEMYDNFTKKYSANLSSTINRINSKNLGSYSPQIGNNKLQQISGMQRPPTQEELDRWLKSPHSNQANLRKASNYLDIAIMQYKRALDHFSKISTFRYDLRLQSDFELKDKSTVLNSRGRILDFLRDFGIKHHSTLVMDKIMKEGVAFYYFETSGDFNSMLELPTDYCYITGTWDRGFTFAIDLTFFDTMVGMEGTMPEIYEYYKTFIKMREISKGDKSVEKLRYYAVPIEKGFCFTFGLGDETPLPPLSGIFRDANRILQYKNLLMQKTALETWKIIGQKIPIHKDDQVPILTPEQAQMFVDFVQEVLPDGTAVFATPMDFEVLELNDGNGKDNITGRGEESYWRSVGINGTMMDAGDKSATTLLYSLVNDQAFVEQMYTQFENFINLQLRLISKKYIFGIKLYGNRYTEDSDIKLYKDLCATVNAPVGKLYGLMGYEPFEVVSTIKLENLLDIKEMSLPIIAGSQQSGDGEVGATKKDTSELTESGTQTRDNDSNKNGGVGKWW